MSISLWTRLSVCVLLGAPTLGFPKLATASIAFPSSDTPIDSVWMHSGSIQQSPRLIRIQLHDDQGVDSIKVPAVVKSRYDHEEHQHFSEIVSGGRNDTTTLEFTLVPLDFGHYYVDVTARPWSVPSGKLRRPSRKLLLLVVDSTGVAQYWGAYPRSNRPAEPFATLCSLASSPDRVIARIEEGGWRWPDYDAPHLRSVALKELIWTENCERGLAIEGSTVTYAQPLLVTIGPNWGTAALAYLRGTDTVIVYGASLKNFNAAQVRDFVDITGDGWPEIVIQAHVGARMMFALYVYQWVGKDELHEVLVADTVHFGPQEIWPVGRAASLIPEETDDEAVLVINHGSREHGGQQFDRCLSYYRFADGAFRPIRDVFWNHDSNDSVVVHR